MTAITNATPPVIPQTPARATPIARDGDGDNDGSTGATKSSAKVSPATITTLSPAAQAIVSGK